MYKLVLLTLCFFTAVFTGAGNYMADKSIDSLQQHKNPVDTQSILNDIGNQITEDFSEIYKTIYFLTQNDWPSTNIKNGLSLEFDRIVNLYPYIDGVLVSRDDGSFYTSNKITNDGSKLNLEKLKKSYFNNTTWFKNFEVEKQTIDLNNQLVGLHVSKIFNGENPLTGKKGSWQVYSKKVSVIIGERRSYNVFFFVNNKWIQKSIDRLNKTFLALNYNQHIVFEFDSSSNSNGAPALEFNQNQVLKKLQWKLVYAGKQAPLTVSSTSNYLSYIAIAFIFVLALAIFLSTDNNWTKKIKTMLSDEEIYNVDAISSDLQKMKKNNKTIVTNLDTLNEKLIAIKQEMLNSKSINRIDEIQDMLEKLSKKVLNQDLDSFKDVISTMHSTYTDTIKVVENLKNHSGEKFDENKNIIKNLTKIKDMLKQYRVESLNIGLASESNNIDELQFLSKDLYALSAKLISEIQSFEDSIIINNDSLYTKLNEAIHFLESNLSHLPESDEAANLFAKDLQQVLNDHTNISEKIREELNNRKNHDQRVSGSYQKVSTSLIQSLELLEKEKKKLEASDKALTSIENNVQKILDNHKEAA